MAKKQAPVVVTITKTKHKSQPFTVSIDKPGKAEPYDLDQRYADRDTVRRGALRNLKAQRSPVTGEWFTTDRSGKVTWIEFRYIDRSKGAPKAPRKVTVTNDHLDTAIHVHRSTKKK